MKNLLGKFRKILMVEIEDLHDDLDLFIQVIDDRHRARQITDYVYNENLAILRNEVMGLEDCLRGCSTLDPGTTDSVDELASYLKGSFRERLRSHGYVPALNSLLDKRIDKIAAYLKLELAGDAAQTAAAPPVRDNAQAADAAPVGGSAPEATSAQPHSPVQFAG
jgi:hypothetical protein